MTTPHSQAHAVDPESAISELALLEGAPSEAWSPGPIWRTAERLVAGIALITALPVLLAIALIIRLDSPGPILFRQPRVGRGGRTFRFTKFRTLVADARQRFPELYAYRYGPDEVENLHFHTADDPRVTRVGRWLRKSSLDELPNLWHVVTGDMALVGPRPQIPEMVPYYSADGLRRFSVRPGVTGLAEVSGRSNLSFREKEQLDIEYVRNRSPWLYVRILARTVAVVMRRTGAI